MSFTTAVREDYARLAAAQKPGHGVPWYMRVVNRRLGRLLAAVAARLRLVPDQVTALSALSVLSGVALLVAAEPSVPVAVGVVLLLQLGFALDSADGQLARLTGAGSPAGEWLDHVVDAGRVLVLHLGVAVALYRHGDVDAGWLLLPLGFCVVASVRFFAQILAEQLERGHGASAGGGSRGSAWIQTPADAGVVNFSLLLWASAPAFLVGYGALAAAHVLLLAATVARTYRRLRAA